MKFIRDNFANKKLSIQMIADNTYLSKTYLCSFFKKSTGKTVNEYIMEIRIEKAKELLKENRVKLYEIATNIGFNDSNYFSAIFKKYVGCTPSEFREKYYV
jgi:two-component system response regulator YesN